MTAREWIDEWPAYNPIRQGDRIGIRDTRDIDRGRVWLWNLDDYRVSSVSGGMIWLIPKGDAAEPPPAAPATVEAGPENTTPDTVAVDVAVSDAGSIVLFHLLTSEARAWVDEHVSEDRQIWAGALAVEPRYVEALATSMQDDGLVVCLEDR